MKHRPVTRTCFRLVGCLLAGFCLTAIWGCSAMSSQQVCVTDPDCADGDDCTTDVCTDGVCSNIPIDGCTGRQAACTVDSDCDDGDACTNDVCEGQQCVSTVVECIVPGEVCVEGVCTSEVACQGTDCDADNDGVPDGVNLCPRTPPDSIVDADGCNVDPVAFSAVITGCPSDARQGDSITLVASAPNAPGPTVFEWFIDGIPSGTLSERLTFNMLGSPMLVTVMATVGVIDDNGTPEDDSDDIVLVLGGSGPETASCSIAVTTEP